MSLQFAYVRAFGAGIENQEGQFISIPTHHQRLGGRRLSLPDVSSFFRHPGNVQCCLSIDFCPDDAEFPATYLIFYTYDRTLYRYSARSIYTQIQRRWFGEVVVLRCGRGNGDIVNMDLRRGDSRNTLWRLIQRYLFIFPVISAALWLTCDLLGQIRGMFP